MADIIGDIVKLTIAAKYPGPQILMNNIHYVVTATTGASMQGSLAVSKFTLYDTNLLPLMSPDSQLYGWRVGTINRTPNPLPLTHVNALVGTDTPPPLPSQARPIGRFATAFAGRGYRGRLFGFPPSTDFMSVAGTPLAAYLTAWQTVLSGLATAFTSGGTTFTPCIAHRSLGPIVTWSSTPITTGTAVEAFGTQRRSGNTGRLNVNPW